ncbi:Protein bric-a-brac-like protein [Leptotrombidium deliense]|uniref:Protein bric-a-brac-like protein n=1 Tax=Leptotrombidium deliense TaxID=299467 RepID=A0A443SDJ4_9ACAR|nr:Protein bric-a-brac-like protein [Leptotrombidium deliense]
MTSSTGSQQSYCLRRNNHQSDLVDDLEHMLNDESLVDVTLLCDEGTIRAHKLILSACSSYFRSIFSKLSNPLHYPVIIIKDMPFCDLKAIIEYIYRGEVNVPHEQLPSVLKSAELLKVKGLLDVNTAKSSVCGNGQLNAKKRKKRRRRISRSGSNSNSTDSFSEKGNMKRHTQIHLQQRNRYMCDLCSKELKEGILMKPILFLQRLEKKENQVQIRLRSHQLFVKLRFVIRVITNSVFIVKFVIKDLQQREIFNDTCKFIHTIDINMSVKSAENCFLGNTH